MSYELPTSGELDWDVKLNASIEAVKATADAAATSASLTSHTGNTSNPHSVTKTQVGLGSVDNTSDADKPVSTATQSALDLKQDLDSDLTAIAALSPSNDDVIQRKAGAWTNRTMAQVKTDLALVKGDVGLGNVDNTSDANKPVSTATQTALDAKADLTRTINAQTGTSYTLVAGDAGDFVTMTNASASTLTVPPNSSVAFAVGTIIEGAQLGAGQVTLTPGSGVTINGTPGLKIAAQYGTFGLLKTATDTWLAFGRLSA